MAFYQKYRPKLFSELIGEEHISATILQGVISDKLTHAYLLAGPRGTGKTTTARLLAKAINCLEINKARTENRPTNGEPCNKCESCREINQGRSIDMVEIDAASHTKVDEIREVIENARYMPTKSLKKVYIIDEVHMLSNSSFNALLKTLEEPPNHVVFILATTEANKLPATILSRTQRYDFHRISKSDIIKNLKFIAKAEKIEIEDSALDLIAVSAEGGHRDAIGLLEQVASSSHQKLSKDNVEKILGVASLSEVFDFLRAIFNNNPEEGLKIAHRLYENGASMIAFNRNLVEIMRKMLLFLMSSEILFEDTKENIKSIEQISSLTNISLLLEKIDNFIKAGQMLKESAYPLLPIEIAVIKSCSPKEKTNSSDQNTKEDKSKPENNPKSAVESEKKEEEQVKNSESSSKEIDQSDKIEEKLAVPVNVLQMTEDLWQKVIEITKKQNATLAALLRDAKPIEVTDNKVILGVKFPFHKDKISEEKNIKFLEDIFSELTGEKCILSCKISETKKRVGQVINDDELQKVAEEIFS